MRSSGSAAGISLSAQVALLGAPRERAEEFLQNAPVLHPEIIRRCFDENLGWTFKSLLERDDLVFTPEQEVRLGGFRPHAPLLAKRARGRAGIEMLLEQLETAEGGDLRNLSLLGKMAENLAFNPHAEEADILRILGQGGALSERAEFKLAKTTNHPEVALTLSYQRSVYIGTVLRREDMPSTEGWSARWFANHNYRRMTGLLAQAELERATWSALLPGWEGSLGELITAARELGPTT